MCSLLVSCDVATGCGQILPVVFVLIVLPCLLRFCLPELVAPLGAEASLHIQLAHVECG
jgi:hypothetical protein